MNNKKTKLLIGGLLLLILLSGFAIIAKTALAADPIKLQMQIGIPGTEFNNKDGKIMTMSDTRYISSFAKAIYNYGLSVIAILAAIILMGAGVIWLTSGGNETRISQAKELISGAIIGLVILISAWIILNTINPDLVNFKPSSIMTIEEMINNSISCNTTTSSSTCSTIAFCVWKDGKCVGKVEGGAAKCSTNKSEVPAPAICCCQSNPSGYVNCKWATYMGSAWIIKSDDPQGAPTAGPCAACGSTDYGQVRSGQEYRCQKAYEEEQAAKNNTSTAFSLTGCKGKKDKASCTRIADLGDGSQATAEGFCLEGICRACYQPGHECGNVWTNNFMCATKAGADGKCGSEHHGNCKLKLNQENFCEPASN